MVQQTSAQTYYSILQSGELGESQKKVLEVLIDTGPRTGSEVNRLLGTSSGHKRLSELKAMGVVCEGPPRICTITGREAIAWEVTGHAPKKPVAAVGTGTPSRGEYLRAIEELRVLVRFRKLYDPNYVVPEELTTVGRWLRKKTT